MRSVRATIVGVRQEVTGGWRAKVGMKFSTSRKESEKWGTPFGRHSPDLRCRTDDQGSNTGALLHFLLQFDCELSFTRVGGIIEGFASAIAFGGVEIDTMLEAIRQPDESRLALGIGAEFEIESADVHESVGDVNTDLGGVNRRAGRVRNCEVRGAGADAAVD